MPATANTQILFDGERTAIMKFDFITTDTTGETLVVKVDPANLLPSASGLPCTNVSLLKITGLTHGLEVRMFWETDTDPIIIETLPPETQYIQDYSLIGGLTTVNLNNTTGRILFSTQDTGANDTYTVILEMQKYYS